MNFIDTFDITSSPTPPPGQPETSLNEEVQQVVGQLSRFWGGFRKQSQAVIETARKDLSEAVTQAQKEFSKLAETPASTSSTEAESSASTAGENEDDADKETTPSASTIVASPEDGSPEPEAGSSQPPSQTLLSRLQSTLPPNLVSSVQDRLPESLKHAHATSLSTLDLAALRSTIAGELARVQGSSEELLHRMQGQSEELLQRVQAREFLQKGEGLLKQVQGGGEEFLREAGEFLREAVRVVPPDGSEGSAGVMWDGTDVWMIPAYSALPSAEAGPSDSAKGKERRSMDSVRAATRAQAMLTQLRHDPQIVRADPAASLNEREAFAAWTAREVDAKGGIDGAVWAKRVEDEKAERSELPVLLQTLVPTEMDESTFWTHYFFRVYQVEREEERRRALLQGTTENEEDFSWEDDEDEAPAASTPSSGKPMSSPASAIPPAKVAAISTPTASTPTTGSPRQSSEESYDVVSSQVSRAASTVDMAEEKEEVDQSRSPKSKDTGKEKEGGDEDEDSDWE